MSHGSPERAPSIASTVVTRRGRGGRGGGRRGALAANSGRAAAAEAITDESSLFSMVKSGRSLHTIIDKWIDEYNQHPDNALVKLQQFFVSCAGCKGVISSVMIQKMDYKDIIRRLTEEFDEESGDYPLMMSGPQWRKFKTNFPEFILLLISKCKLTVVFDSKTMDGLIQLLTGLADSQVRAFRHTATFAAMKLSTALVSIACELVKMRDLNNKQIETEKSKAKSTNDRVQKLLEKKSEIEEQISDVRCMIQYIFKSVFVHRYRDIVAEIRAVSIEELGNWMYLFPEQFLDDSYLKYIGWMLYDKNPEVRMKCLGALIPLYERRELAQSLELFTTKFKERLATMVRDKDYDVAIKACQLMTCVYNILPDVLDIQSCEYIYELVYCSNRGIATAAGEFLNAKVFGEGQDKDVEYKKLLIVLVEFFIEGGLHSHGAYLIDALIDSNPIIKDFSTMAELLLSNESDGCATHLVELMSCAVRQTATGKSPVGRSHHHKRGGQSLPTKEARLLQEDRNKMTEDLIPVLPQLINKFVADQETLENLCDFPRYFILEMYLAGRQEKFLAELMKALEQVIERHTDSELLLVVSRTIGALLQNANIATYTETARHRIIDTIGVQLRCEIQRFLNEVSMDDDDNGAFLACMRKISIFASTQDLSQWDLWGPVFSILSNNEDRTASRDVAEHAVQFLFLSLSHDFSVLYEKVEENPTENVTEAVRSIKVRRDQFMSVVEQILRIGAAGVENAFLCVCDLLMLFNWRLRPKNAVLGPLVINVTTDFIHQMDCFVVDNVFVEEGEEENRDAFGEQQRVELMHKRRNLLAQFCKLIIYNVVPMSHMWVVLKYYDTYFRDFGDIMKNMIHKVRDLHKLQCAHGVANALIDHYKRIRSAVTDGLVDPINDDFLALRDLAKKLAQSFGSDHVKNRDVIAGVHREGILFALNEKNDSEAVGENGRSKNMPFLEIILEFSTKLLKQDRACVLHYLERQIDPMSLSVKDCYWQPYILYKDSLQERNCDNVSIRSGISPGPRKRSRVRKATESEED